MARDLNIIQDFDEYYNDAYAAWDPYFPLAERDLKFFLGDQWDEQEKRQLFQEGRSTFVFNYVRRVINMVSGYQRKNRLSSVVAPIENSDQKTADQLSQLLLYVMNYGEGYQTISDSFSGALKTGWNLMSLWVDYRDDPVNGDIKFAREPYNGFILDPYLTKTDLSDCQYILRRKYLGADHVASLLPGMEKEVYQLNKIGYSRDDKFTWLPYQRNPNGQDMMAYNEMYEQKWRKVPVLVDMETGETTEFDMDKDTLNMFLRQYPQLKVVQQSKKYIEKNIIVNDQLMKTEENPFGLDEYPFVPFTAIFEPESDQWGLKVQSLIRCMVDPQRESNRRRSQMVDILDSQINSGWIANENSVINPRSLFQSSQGKVIWKREDAPADALTKIPAAQIPPSMFQLQELFNRDMVEIAGVNDAAFGQTENAQESGVMMMLRQGASLVNLQELFDNLRNSQKSLSKKVLKLIQQWTPSKVQRIINEEPTQEFYNREFTKYDVTVQEGILTDTQRQMYFRQLVDLRNLGAPVSGEMLAKAAPIQGKSDYIEELAAMEKQQAEQAQKQQQVQDQVLQTQSEASQAKAISDVSLAAERRARTHSNLALSAERVSESEQNRANAALDRARTITEISKLEDERLFRLFEMVKILEKEEEIDREKVGLKVGVQAQNISQDVKNQALVKEASTSPQPPMSNDPLAGGQL